MSADEFLSWKEHVAYMTQYQQPTQLGNTQMFMQTHICELKPSVTVLSEEDKKNSGWELYNNLFNGNYTVRHYFWS